MHKGASLGAREYGLIQLMLLGKLLAGENQAASRSPQRFVGRGRGHMGIRDGTGMASGRYQAGNMRHIHHQVRSHFVRNLPELFKINGSGVCAGSGHNQFRPAFQGDSAHFVIVNKALVIHSVGYGFIIGSGKVSGTSMGQMASVRQVHAHYGITGLKQREKYRHVCLCA